MNTYSEAEAKTKWCPLARVLVTTDISEVESGKKTPKEISTTSANRFPVKETGEELGSLCIGPACMAWRWTVGTAKDQKENKGYCGAFGK